MPKVFDLRNFIRESVKQNTPDAIIIISCLTWVPDAIGKTKDEIIKKHSESVVDEWFIESEE